MGSPSEAHPHVTNHILPYRGTYPCESAGFRACIWRRHCFAGQQQVACFTSCAPLLFISHVIQTDSLHLQAISQALKNNLQKWKSGMERSLRELIGDKTIVHVGTASRKIFDVVQVINLLPCYLISHELVSRWLCSAG
jgi:hypothetical protein